MNKVWPKIQDTNQIVKFVIKDPQSENTISIVRYGGGIVMLWD